MSRKTLLSLLSLLAVMVVGIALAVVFLYSGSEEKKTLPSQAAEGSGLELLSAVPADAVAVRCMSDCGDMEGAPFITSSIFSHAGSADAVVSYHHAKTIVPLYIIDAGRASAVPGEEAAALIDSIRQEGLHVEYLDCSTYGNLGRNLSARSLIVASKQENLVKSSLRHLEKGVSVMDAPGFADAVAKVRTKDALFLSNEHFRKLMDTAVSRKYSRHSSFFSRFADWVVLDTGSDEMNGFAVYDKGGADFMKVLEAYSPSVSSVSAVLPAYTLSAVTLPVSDIDRYLSVYESYVDSRQELADYKARLRVLSATAGCTAGNFVSGISEIAHASFKVKGNVEEVNLVHISKDALKSLYPESSVKGYEPAVHDYKYQNFLSSLFGKLFQLPDETCYTFFDGWIISGSRTAVSEYASKAALEYTLQDKMKDAGEDDLFAESPVSALAYFSFTEDRDELRNVFSTSFLSLLSPLIEGYDYCPLIAKVGKNKKEPFVSVRLVKAAVQRSKAPVTERDTTVLIPSGPFQVKNSGTGKMNEFYQNDHLSLCLRQEGKDLWGIPFKDRICGTVHTVDYFANGKLQFLFGAGSKLYLLDRLGRFVNGFPVELGKKILLGPDVYDFNGINKYNVIVLHDDKTIEMYNMKGQKPESWKGIISAETIKSLPERIIVGGKSFWVVRTSVQTQIYPFTGGEPLVDFEKDKKIRPDSEVKVIDITSVEVECYDGKRRTVKLK